MNDTTTSAAIEAGEPIAWIAAAAMTLDVYSGLFDDDLDMVAERWDVAAASARVPRVRP